MSSNEMARTNSNETKHCWVCFLNSEDDYSAPGSWVAPCKCKGTAKWVHKQCLQRWIDEKQQGNSSIQVSCPQCNCKYTIVYPDNDMFVRCMDLIDRILNEISPYVAGGVLVGSLFWTAVTYGAVSIMQVLGHEEGLAIMEKADPLIMIVGLPSIPLFLVLGRLIRWQDAILKFYRKIRTKYPFIFSSSNGNEQLPRTPTDVYSSTSDAISLTRMICGGLISPTIATLVGELFYRNVKSNIRRFIFGGLTYIGVKGLAKIYYKHQQYLRQAHREIRSYNPQAQSSSNINNYRRYSLNNIDNNNINGATTAAASAANASNFGGINTANRRSTTTINENNLIRSESNDI